MYYSPITKHNDNNNNNNHDNIMDVLYYYKARGIHRKRWRLSEIDGCHRRRGLRRTRILLIIFTEVSDSFNTFPRVHINDGLGFWFSIIILLAFIKCIQFKHTRARVRMQQYFIIATHCSGGNVWENSINPIHLYRQIQYNIKNIIV